MVIRALIVLTGLALFACAGPGARQGSNSSTNMIPFRPGMKVAAALLTKKNCPTSQARYPGTQVSPTYEGTQQNPMEKQGPSGRYVTSRSGDMGAIAIIGISDETDRIPSNWSGVPKQRTTSGLRGTMVSNPLLMRGLDPDKDHLAYDPWARMLLVTNSAQGLLYAFSVGPTGRLRQVGSPVSVGSSGSPMYVTAFLMPSRPNQNVGSEMGWSSVAVVSSASGLSFIAIPHIQGQTYEGVPVEFNRVAPPSGYMPGPIVATQSGEFVLVAMTTRAGSTMIVPFHVPTAIAIQKMTYGQTAQGMNVFGLASVPQDFATLTSAGQREFGLMRSIAVEGVAGGSVSNLIVNDSFAVLLSPAGPKILASYQGIGVNAELNLTRSMAGNYFAGQNPNSAARGKYVDLAFDGIRNIMTVQVDDNKTSWITTHATGNNSSSARQGLEVRSIPIPGADIVDLAYEIPTLGQNVRSSYLLAAPRNQNQIYLGTLGYQGVMLNPSTDFIPVPQGMCPFALAAGYATQTTTASSDQPQGDATAQNQPEAE